MSKKIAIFDFPQNTQLRLHQKSDAKTKINTLTFPLSPTAIIFLGHSNSKMLNHLHFSYHSMSWTVLHDASKVLFKPLLNFALGFSEVRYIQLIKLVPQKNSNSFSCEFNGKKIEKRRGHVEFVDSG